MATRSTSNKPGEVAKPSPTPGTFPTPAPAPSSPGTERHSSGEPVGNPVGPKGVEKIETPKP